MTVIPVSRAQQSNEPVAGEVESGLAQIRQVDHSFDENLFNDLVMDNFFKIQGAWMNRDLSPEITAILIAKAN